MFLTSIYRIKSISVVREVKKPSSPLSFKVCDVILGIKFSKNNAVFYQDYQIFSPYYTDSDHADPFYAGTFTGTAEANLIWYGDQSAKIPTGTKSTLF